MLYKLLSATDRRRFAPTVISLKHRGALAPRIESLGIEVHSMDINPSLPDPRSFFYLARLLRELKPQLVQTWMYHADLIGGATARLSGIRRVVWNLRQSVLDASRLKRGTYLIARLCALSSRRIPCAIVSCSEQARIAHSAFGYRNERMVTIPNGFDLELFRPNPAAREAIRKELSLPAGIPLVGLVARFDPQKDHETFIQAAQRLINTGHDCRFLLCGPGIEHDNEQLVSWIEGAGIIDKVHLLGRRSDTPSINAALDLAISASAYGEGFPNVLGEAMACGVPCVTTNVGDSALIVGDTGRVTPPGDASALADAMADILCLNQKARLELGESARRRIEGRFSLPLIAANYETLYSKCLLAAP